jgi:indole-3-glycerol phosphate synthase
MSRFSQAISEGDGISVIPVVDGDAARLAPLAEAAGAEAIAVETLADAAAAREAVSLPILVREPIRDRAVLDRVAPAADAFVVLFDDVANRGELLEDLHREALERDVDCMLDVRDDEELERALERVDPDIVLVARRDGGTNEEQLERALDLLPDVPAGKLVVAESDRLSREQVLALERAGVDALIVRDLAASPDFAELIEELVGGRPRGG